MNSSVSEADAGEHAGQVHAGPSLQILGVPHRSVNKQTNKPNLKVSQPFPYCFGPFAFRQERGMTSINVLP